MSEEWLKKWERSFDNAMARRNFERALWLIKERLKYLGAQIEDLEDKISE